jgi:hypothetical protein
MFLLWTEADKERGHFLMKLTYINTLSIIRSFPYQSSQKSFMVLLLALFSLIARLTVLAFPLVLFFIEESVMDL